MPFFYDSTFIILIPAILLSLWAQYKVKNTFEKYSRVTSTNGYTGQQVARMLLDSKGLYNVPVEITSGKLSDHYDPSKKVMRLSEDVFYGTSVASIGVAAHETGHAIQHKESYTPLVIRDAIVPAVNFSSNLSWILLFIGLILGSGGTLLINAGILLFTIVVFFQLVTLPVEFDASKRALSILKDGGILYANEASQAKEVLDAAALTYVAAALTAILQLVRLIAIGRERN